MTTHHHPDDEILLRRAAGRLAAGPSAVVATHLACCPRCRLRIEEFEALGGALLEAEEPNALASAVDAQMPASLERPSPRSRSHAAAPARPTLPPDIVWPPELANTAFGRWRWLAPGIHVSKARGGFAHTRLELLRIGAGKRLLQHTHDGNEWTCVISGAFRDGQTRFAAGDFVEVDGTTDHQPVVDSDEQCICLVAMEGKLRPHSFIARLYLQLLDA